MWNGAFIHWIGQRSRPLIRLPGNADNRNGLYRGMKLDERKPQTLACGWIRHSAQYAAGPLAPYAGCKHIANATMRLKIESICRSSGYEPPIICTPLELMED